MIESDENLRGGRKRAGSSVRVPAPDPSIRWAQLADEDVLTGRLDHNRPSRLGLCINGSGLHADLHVSPDAAGRIMLRIPESVSPTPAQFFRLEDVDEIWEPVIDAEAGLLGGRGLLHYHTFRLPGNQVFLDIFVEEMPFGCCA